MFLIVLGAAVVPFFARRMRVPSAALEIVYGLLLFNFVLDHRPEWFHLFRELGLVYLMFIAGMELDLRALVRSGRSGWYVLVSLLSFAVTPLLFVALGFPFYLGVAVAMISAGIVVPVLKETDLMKTPLGQNIMGVALTGELLSILVLTFIDAYHKHGPTVMAAVELLKLTGVYLNLPQIWGRSRDQLDIFPYQAAKHLAHVKNQAVQTDNLRFNYLATGKG